MIPELSLEAVSVPLEALPLPTPKTLKQMCGGESIAVFSEERDLGWGGGGVDSLLSGLQPLETYPSMLPEILIRTLSM